MEFKIGDHVRGIQFGVFNWAGVKGIVEGITHDDLLILKITSLDTSVNYGVNKIYNVGQIIDGTYPKCWQLDTDKQITLPGIKEIPCGICKRMNDIGIKVCWCCGSNI